MQQLLFAIVFMSSTLAVKSQTASVEKSLFGVQTGFLDISAHHEAKLTNQIVLRTEVGFDSGIWYSDFYDEAGFILMPVIFLEPKWYYNLAKRESKGKRIDHNSGNFIGLKTYYHPDWFVISTHDNLRVISDISIVPTWGIRRNIGQYFNYEAGLGIGYRYLLGKQANYIEDKGELIASPHLKIGFSF